MGTYTALGLSDSGHVELADHYTESQCRAWINRYTRRGDFGGYYGIALVAPDGGWLETYCAHDED